MLAEQLWRVPLQKRCNKIYHAINSCGKGSTYNIDLHIRVLVHSLLEISRKNEMAVCWNALLCKPGNGSPDRQSNPCFNFAPGEGTTRISSESFWFYHTRTSVASGSDGNEIHELAALRESKLSHKFRPRFDNYSLKQHQVVFQKKTS